MHYVVCIVVAATTNQRTRIMLDYLLVLAFGISTYFAVVGILAQWF